MAARRTVVPASGGGRGTRSPIGPAGAAVDNPDVAALVQSYADRHGLSGREHEVLSLGARGLHRKGTAMRLGCSPGTIDTYWNRILRKLQLSSQSEVLASLLRLALSRGPLRSGRPRRREPGPLGVYRRSRQDSWREPP